MPFCVKGAKWHGMGKNINARAHHVFSATNRQLPTEFPQVGGGRLMLFDGRDSVVDEFKEYDDYQGASQHLLL